MQNESSSYLDEVRFVSLLVVLVASPPLYFRLSPSTALTDLPEIAFMGGLIVGILVFAILFQIRDGSDRLKKRLTFFGWGGGIMGGCIGIALAAHHLAQGVPIIQACDEVLLLFDIGIVGGAVSGLALSTDRPAATRQENDEGHLLTESTWANRPEPNPIAAEIVGQFTELEGVDSLDMEPLWTHIDPEIFENLRAVGESPWQVIFYINDYEFRVNSYGTVTVYDIQHADKRPPRSSSIREIR